MNITIPTIQIPLFSDDYMNQFNEPAVQSYVGMKFDSSKSRPSLLPFDALSEVVKVLDYGATKYAPDNWKHVVPRSRYIDAAFRHMFQWQSGEDNDQETNISHLAHAATNLLFLIHFQLNGETPRESH